MSIANSIGLSIHGLFTGTGKIISDLSDGVMGTDVSKPKRVAKRKPAKKTAKPVVKATTSARGKTVN